MLPGLDVAAIRHYCEQRVAPHALHQVRVEAQVNARSVTIVERRAPWREDYSPEWTTLGIARLRYVAKTGLWTLYWRDRNQRWHLHAWPATHVTSNPHLVGTPVRAPPS